MGSFGVEKKDGTRTMISDQVVKRVEGLAGLRLSSQERELVKRDMGRMIDCVDRLLELEIGDTMLMPYVFPVSSGFREDIVTGVDHRKDTLLNAPERKQDWFLVPKTV